MRGNILMQGIAIMRSAGKRGPLVITSMILALLHLLILRSKKLADGIMVYYIAPDFFLADFILIMMKVGIGP